MDDFNVDDMITGWDRMRELADSEDHIIPGHDPEVLVRYAAYSPIAPLTPKTRMPSLSQPSFIPSSPITTISFIE